MTSQPALCPPAPKWEPAPPTLQAGAPRPPGAPAAFFLRLHLLTKIPFRPDLFDHAQLRFKPVDMFFGIHDHIFQNMPCREISDLGTVRNGFAKRFRIFPLKLQICRKERRHILPMRNGIKMLDVRRSIQVEKMIDEGGRMADLFMSQMAVMIMQSLIPPVFAQCCMQQILMYSGQLRS